MRLAPTAIVAAAALVGVAGGLGLYTFVYAKGYSYITNDPAACANCHVMNDQYDGWLKSSHRAIAVCNDCADECRKHETKHPECKACGDSCVACVKEMKKLPAKA